MDETEGIKHAGDGMSNGEEQTLKDAHRGLTSPVSSVQTSRVTSVRCDVTCDLANHTQKKQHNQSAPSFMNNSHSSGDVYYARPFIHSSKLSVIS